MEILKISGLALARLKNAEHVAFHSNVRTAIENADPEEMGLASVVYNPFRQAINQEQDIVNKAQASPYTAEMVAADQKRDLVFRRIYRKLQLCELEDENSTAHKANNVVQKSLLSKYPSSTPSLAYQEASATYTGFVLDCRNLLSSEEVKAIGIDGDLDDLDSANQRFCRMYQERVAEKAESQNLSPRLRAVTDEAYERLTITLNAMANDVTEANQQKVTLCCEVIMKVNVIIADAKARLNQRLGGVVEEEEVPVEGE